MDFHLDALLNLPHVTVWTTERKEGLIILKLEFLIEKVKELTLEQVSKNEQLSPEQVQNIFSRQATRKKKTGDYLNA